MDETQICLGKLFGSGSDITPPDFYPVSNRTSWPLDRHGQAANSEEQFVQTFARHERDLRVFVRSMGLDWNAVDDVMKTVSLVMWRKWSEFDKSTDYLAWARVISRYEVLKFRRKMARDRHVFSEDQIELLASSAEELYSRFSSDDYRVALQKCLASLPDESGQLVQAAYRGDRTIREVASELGQSATAFYKMLNRIRVKLRGCIQQRLETMQ
ncbi:MAG: sigma-70 family RNA polymerase sigma factor [Planctomycetota bacterium]